MRVVLDTNTVISAILWDKIPWQAYSGALEGKYTLLTCDPMLEELRNVLNRPKFAPSFAKIKKAPEVILRLHEEISERVTPAQIPDDIIRDPKDRIILACAVGGQADFIVSGDKDLLVLGSYQTSIILSSTEFALRLTQGTS